MTGLVLVTGAGGFIGGQLVRSLAERDVPVRAVDLKPLEHWFYRSERTENLVADLRDKACAFAATRGAGLVYNLAADMGGMGFIENHKALCMLSVLINTNLLMAAREHAVRRFFFASSACVYPDYRQNEDRKSTRLNSSHIQKSRMPSSA